MARIRSTFVLDGYCEGRADIKVQQELLRHSTIQSTLNTYTQAISEQKRAANTIVVGILFNENASTEPAFRLMGAKKAL